MEPNEVKNSEVQHKKKLALGVIVIAAGLLLLLVNIGFLPYRLQHIFFSWQMLLITIGIISFLSSESKMPGTILILIGGFFIMPRIFDLPFNWMHLFWPLILILLGVLILFKHSSHHKVQWRFQKQQPFQTLEEGYIYEDNIFSGGKQRVVNQVFKGGHINCIFGGSEVDLTQASLAEGTSELEINTIFGGVTLIIPGDWKIQMKMTSIMGGFSDKRAYIKENPDTSRMLVIKGSTIFGGGEIKSY